MGLGIPILYDDHVWRAFYVSGEPRLTPESRNRVLWNMIDMYKKGEKLRRLKSD